MKNYRIWFLRAAALLLLAALLAWAFRNAPLAQIWTTLRRLQLWQIGVIGLVNGLIYLLISLRWWIIVRAQNRGVSFFSLLAARVAAFGVSYFTLGPQVGGEPLQVLALQRRHGLTYSRATASVLMDKLLEFLVNFLLLALGLGASLQAAPRVLAGNNDIRLVVGLAGLFLLMLWPPVHILLLYNHFQPLTWLLRALPFAPARSRVARFLRAAEWLAGTFCRHHPRALLASLGVSLLAGAGMLLDYALMLDFLGIHLSIWQSLAGGTAGWLSFLAPLPGGLGALEASQVLALGFFGVSSAAAASVTLLMRARDLFVGSLGLLLAGNDFSRVK